MIRERDDRRRARQQQEHCCFDDEDDHSSGSSCVAAAADDDSSQHHTAAAPAALVLGQKTSLSRSSVATFATVLVVIILTTTMIISESSLFMVHAFQPRPPPCSSASSLRPAHMLPSTRAVDGSHTAALSFDKPRHDVVNAWFFVSAPRRRSTTTRSITALHVGGGGGGGIDDGPPPGDNNDDDTGKNEQWDDFFREESDNLRKAREYMSEYELPISYSEHDDDKDAAAKANEKEKDDEENDVAMKDEENQTFADPSSSSSALVRGDASGVVVFPDSDDESSIISNKELLERNPYMAVVSTLSPSEMIAKFSASAHPSVQNAVRSTILSLIGGLPKMAFDTTTITTGKRLASLMFQLQMTGYMFKNAEYRLSLQQSLGLQNQQSSSDMQQLLPGDAHDDDDDEERFDPLEGKVRGKVKVRYGGKSSKDDENDDDDDKDALPKATDKDQEDDDDDSASAAEDGSSKDKSPRLEMQVDAAAYMSELRSEVSQLREELYKSRQEQEEVMRKDLLQYIRTLPEQELRSLTNTISQDVLVSMKGLVQAVMQGIGEAAASSTTNDDNNDNAAPPIGPDTVTEQSGEAMAQLCMWQLVVGYNLRTLEVREEMKKSLLSGASKDSGKSVESTGTDDDLGTFE